MRQFGIVLIVTAVLAGLAPTTAWAQSGAIAGVVRDTTGAVLPGVTVEAASPALIEKVRTVVTDDAGQYKIIDLRPGTYAVTFTLTGFNPVKREGIELTTGFTANVNADLRVGSVEETVLVSGQTPVVDVQNVVQQRVVTRDVIDRIPTGRIYLTYATLLPGTTQRGGQNDVGGMFGDQQQAMMIHGSRQFDQRIHLNGMSISGTEANGGAIPFSQADVNIQEVQLEFGAQSAETDSGGMRFNIIPKEGGNSFTGTLLGAYTNDNLQGTNLTDDLKAKGLKSTDSIVKIWDSSASLGGPIKQDKLWFFVSGRYWGNFRNVGGNFYNLNPQGSFLYTPDLSRPALDDQNNSDVNLRLTWQVNAKNRVTGFIDNQRRWNGHWPLTPLLAPEAAGYQTLQTHSPTPYQVTWTVPLSNRLLFDAGATQMWGDWELHPSEPGVTLDTIPITDIGLNYTYRNRTGFARTVSHQRNYRAAVSYVTGSHAAKMGVTFLTLRGWSNQYSPVLRYTFRNQVPVSLTMNANPRNPRQDIPAQMGIFAQDQWKLDKWTVNAGLRYDYFKGRVPEQLAGPGPFTPNRNQVLPAIDDVPNWKDLEPRLSVAYDLAGSGRTALKFSLGRFVVAETVSISSGVNPLSGPAQTTNRSWNDSFFPAGDPRRGNFAPDCDLLNPGANQECGAWSVQAFGGAVPLQRYSDEVTKGFNARPSNWETSFGVQHELRPGVGLNATYFRRWYANFSATQNLATGPGDYDPFCVTAPTDSRLGDVSGSQVCDLWDIKPTKFGQVNNLIVPVKTFGKQSEVYNGVDLTTNVRLPRGVLLQGGLNTGRVALDFCDVVSNASTPTSLNSAGGQPITLTGLPSQRFCKITPKFLTQFKFQGSYPLPWDTQLSAVFQSIPGPEINAVWQASSSAVSGLGRPLLGAGNGIAVIQLMEPGQTFAGRLNQVDLRVSKGVKVNRTRVQGIVEIFNAFNVSPILAVNTTFGPNWQVPTLTLPARFVKFSAKIDF